MAAVLNVVQVGIGLTQFGPFRAAAQANPELEGVAFSVVAFSFFGYNAAKILLGLAAIVFGMAKMKAGGKLLGGAAALVGVIALVANALVMMFGLDGFVPEMLLRESDPIRRREIFQLPQELAALNTAVVSDERAAIIQYRVDA